MTDPPSLTSGSPKKNKDRKSQDIGLKIWPWVPEGARHQDWPSAVTWLWLTNQAVSWLVTLKLHLLLLRKNNSSAKEEWLRTANAQRLAGFTPSVQRSTARDTSAVYWIRSSLAASLRRTTGHDQHSDRSVSPATCGTHSQLRLSLPDKKFPRLIKRRSVRGSLVAHQLKRPFSGPPISLSE
jgi:hypothetical protein